MSLTSLRLSFSAKKLFTGKGNDLKLTGSGITSFNVKQGEISLVLNTALKQYEFTISETNTYRRRKMRFKQTDKVKKNFRNNQFTITIYTQTTIVLCGSLSDKADVEKLIDVLATFHENGSTFNRQLLSQDPKVIPKSNELLSKSELKENVDNNHNEKANVRFKQGNVDKVMCSKTNGNLRHPLKKVNGLGSVFPSPTILKNKLHDQPNKDDDCKITAVGVHKTTTFYNKSDKNLKADSYLKFNNRKRFRYNKKIVASPQNVPTSLPVDGFANLGNTCYMNVILQCLLNIPNFYQELRNQNNLDLVEHNSLYNRLCNLAYLKHSNESILDQKNALQLVKTAISAAAKRFSGYSQHDAHEFLCQCLDQLKEDLSKKVDAKKEDLMLAEKEWESLFTCPIKENFEITVMHSIKCLSCNEEIFKEEMCNDFSLVLPEIDENRTPSSEMEISKLLRFYFSDELIDYTCEKCNGDQSILSHRFQKLPRVLVLHLKRYDVSHMKRTDPIGISKKIILHQKYLPRDDCQTVLPKSFEFEKDTITRRMPCLKRRLSEHSDDDLPQFKLTKHSDSLNCDNKRQLLEQNNNEVSIVENGTKYSNNQHTQNEFTKVRDSKRELNFKSVGVEDEKSFSDSSKQIHVVSDESVDNSSNASAPLPRCDDEDEELQRVLEMSMREYEEQQRKDANQLFSSPKSSSTPTTKRKPLSNLTSSFDFNDTIGLDDTIEDLDATFNLVGVVNHHGLNAQSGHYTCDCYDFKSKEWRNYNDSSVKYITDNDVYDGRSKSGYIVLYMHSSCFNSICSKF